MKQCDKKQKHKAKQKTNLCINFTITCFTKKHKHPKRINSLFKKLTELHFAGKSVKNRILKTIDNSNLKKRQSLQMLNNSLSLRYSR